MNRLICPTVKSAVLFCNRPQCFLSIIVEVISSLLQDLRRRGTNFSKYRLSSRRKKVWSFSFSYPLWHTEIKFLLGSRSFFGNYCASYKIISLTPKRLLKTQIFEKTILSTEKIFGESFLLVYILINLKVQ